VSPVPIATLPTGAPGQTTFDWAVPAWSINVLEFDLGGWAPRRDKV